MKRAVQIRQMPIELANKIAAGEVVQRPASAAKELLENAIDAGASEISLSVKAAGSSLVQVTDNGAGMGPEDAVQCFERHATSKITSAEDLENIQTLGFRGEALASIAAIAQVSLRTKRAEDEQGVCVRIEGGQVLEDSPCAAAVGTTIAVRNLFFNVPARRSFLKAPSTEFRHLSNAFVAHALANPWITFKLVHNQHEVYRLPGSRAEEFSDALRERVRAVLINESMSYISAVGFLAHPEHAKKSRKDQYLFVNDRPIKSPSLNHAIRSAYDTLLPEGRHPAYVLFLNLSPKHVDVNVHPAKTEVRFDDDRGVYNFVQSISRRALGIADLIPQYPSGASSLSFQRGANESSTSWKPPPRADELPPVQGEQATIVYDIDRSRTPSGATLDVEGFLWQLQDHYILTQLHNGILVVDQQAAHQRILFERALADIQAGIGLSQQLLFPQLICLNQGDCELLRELSPLAMALGFDYSISENRTVTVRGVPSDLQAGAEKRILQSVLDEYKANSELKHLSIQENMARSIAVRGAIYPGVKLNEEEMRTMIDRLFQCEDPYRTPSGNPTLIRLTYDELKQRFNRRAVDHEEPD
ncbi:MAG: DNA mismatch repair endonuclease MutL [Rhodothermaceae bacterium]|nr:DNA mismatch repair endonuclease MutL [Rhodothermaceae bacterium]